MFWLFLPMFDQKPKILKKHIDTIVLSFVFKPRDSRKILCFPMYFERMRKMLKQTSWTKYPRELFLQQTPL